MITNSPAGNAVVAFDRQAEGSLTAAGSYPTGGLGSGAGLGSQGAIIVSDDHRFLFAVNAGSSTISSFRIALDGLIFVHQVPSGGNLPTSLTYRHGLLYVLNAGTPNVLAGFSVSAHGRMTPIPGSARSLSAAQTAPGQVGFSADGSTIVVSERATNLIDTYVVDEFGLLDGPYIHPSAGPTPFGFAVDRRGTVLVSEAGAGGGASTFRADGAELTPVSSMLMTGQRAACWAVITTNGGFGYVSNAGTGNISGFALQPDGSAVLARRKWCYSRNRGQPDRYGAVAGWPFPLCARPDEERNRGVVCCARWQAHALVSGGFDSCRRCGAGRILIGSSIAVRLTALRSEVGVLRTSDASRIKHRRRDH